MASQPNASTTPPTTTSTSTTSTAILSEKEQLRINFYRTYDVMTGIRIAATLGGFFALMVILVVYKSKSKTEKALEDPALAAAAVAEVEEEERQIAAALEETAYQQLNPRRARRSLDTSSVSPAWIRSATRFSSIGGYSSLMEPPTRPHSRLPCFVDEDSPAEDDRFSCEDISNFYSRYLDIPRRSSNITCSSSDSSYLERRGSVALGLPMLQPHVSRRSRRQSSPVPPDHYDCYYPIDIRVTQPTPRGSPCGSERALHDEPLPSCLKPRLAPLASISSCNSSIVADYPDLDSDDVFREEEDTDDEVEEFSTDSEMEEGACCRRKELPKINVSSSMHERATMPEFALVDRVALSPEKLELEKCSWSQETLF